ncbi:unnamed protein product [Vitrella brassicaformis CCMP3155]|uniref:Transmembrane protein n=2 Tax=Vitrella brassicaformis TaxID=1169539 RepID=A0A0G4FI21_VITBC|nr:unnamed protein product [Vitrella brassicaformis CCMP3155]|eukprot:CEM12981.1 unnamed protein product [Vitrella brassicaformis CCMP3155]
MSASAGRGSSPTAGADSLTPGERMQKKMNDKMKQLGRSAFRRTLKNIQECIRICTNCREVAERTGKMVQRCVARCDARMRKFFGKAYKYLTIMNSIRLLTFINCFFILLLSLYFPWRRTKELKGKIGLRQAQLNENTSSVDWGPFVQGICDKMNQRRAEEALLQGINGNGNGTDSDSDTTARQLTANRDSYVNREVEMTNEATTTCALEAPEDSTEDGTRILQGNAAHETAGPGNTPETTVATSTSTSSTNSSSSFDTPTETPTSALDHSTGPDSRGFAPEMAGQLVAFQASGGANGTNNGTDALTTAEPDPDVTTAEPEPPTGPIGEGVYERLQRLFDEYKVYCSQFRSLYLYTSVESKAVGLIVLGCVGAVIAWFVYEYVDDFWFIGCGGTQGKHYTSASLALLSCVFVVVATLAWVAESGKILQGPLKSKLFYVFVGVIAFAANQIILALCYLRETFGVHARAEFRWDPPPKKVREATLREKARRQREEIERYAQSHMGGLKWPHEVFPNKASESGGLPTVWP